MKAFLVYVAFAALTLAVFGLWPDLDLAVAHRFYDGGGFIGRDGLARFGRDVFRVTPFVVLAAYAALWLARRAGRWRGWAPSGRAMIFLIATIAIGPGVVVNLSLKDHWHRPRPYPDPGVQRQGRRSCPGTTIGANARRTARSSRARRRPDSGWSRRRASCRRRPADPAIVAAFAFGVGASLLRMAFGGHYLSDVLLGGLVTLIIIEIARMLIWPRGEDPAAPAPAGGGGQTAAEVVERAMASRPRPTPGTPGG